MGPVRLVVGRSTGNTKQFSPRRCMVSGKGRASAGATAGLKTIVTFPTRTWGEPGRVAHPERGRRRRTCCSSRPGGDPPAAVTPEHRGVRDEKHVSALQELLAVDAFEVDEHAMGTHVCKRVPSLAG